ncbi:proline hydroxylase [Flavipsychrobacter stenotrophus]|uniref:Proline hydroxylase n=1 Tax=Flavipsychrobacter stenotrophus TaxID=2077091 RepID=A0A2S7SQD3_9BACT|nr:2OG-Fe(II) oxygenase [Flavipsychrobacter stenotrophus]PQJ08841.1 proline hydroxylase [Flavipsychrobacter stenotrophus]
MEARFEELIEGFITGNIGISENFLSTSLAAALHQNLLQRDSDDLMVRAGIGNSQVSDSAQTHRGDKTCWLEALTKDSAEMEFLDIIDQFISHLNSTCYTGLTSCEFHYALYEEGKGYARHKDQFRNHNARKFSMISYLNENWEEADGGQLIIHNKDHSALFILPNNQKAVFFQSDKIEHEVAIAQRPRMSITGWLKN